MKTIIRIAILMTLAIPGYSQQNASFNQYIFNKLVLNPAYAGTKQMYNINAIYSSQWTGFAGSPNTQTLSFDAPVSEKIGIGVHFINDRIGAQSHQGLFGSYSYKIKLSDKLKLSLGLSAGASYFTLDGSLLSMENENDPAIPKTKESQLRFDSKTGLFLYSDRFYAGLSISDLLGDVIKSKDLMVSTQARHYYISSGYVFDLSPKFKLKPGLLIKEDFKAPTNIDISTFVLYNERFWLGASVRTGAKIFRNEKIDNSLRMRDAMVFMTEISITDKLRLGYAYTLTLSSLKDYPGHEVHLGYYFPDKTTTRMKTPRYF